MLKHIPHPVLEFVALCGVPMGRSRGILRCLSCENEATR